MKRLLWILLAALPLAAAAQPKWLKKAQKSLCNLYAVQQAGDTLWVPAFYVDAQGTVVAPLKPIQRAREAWTQGDDGRRQVTRIQGFNTTYDVCRLTTEGKAKTTPLPVATVTMNKQERVWLMPAATEDEIVQVESADDHKYYTLREPADFTLSGQPLLDDGGQVVGMLQNPVRTAGAPNYALDIHLAMAMGISALDANNTDLRQCEILKALPTDENQARTFLYLVSAGTARQQYIQDFIKQYPRNSTGYVLAAQDEASKKQYDEAFATYERALKVPVENVDEVFYNRASTVYQALVNHEQVPASWTQDQALSDVQAAYKQNPLPVYMQLEARILFAQKQYDRANDLFLSLTKTNLRSPELFLFAAQCQEKMGLSTDSILAMNDSAMACFSRPYTREAADYLWLRAMRRKEAGQNRAAIQDLNDYEHIMSGQLSDGFYYEREQLEAKSRMLSNALVDIDKAISLASDEPLYHAERAVLLYRGNQGEEAIKSCERAVQLDASFPDAYRIWGICLRDIGRKAEAREKLQKAVDLGDELARNVLNSLEE